LRQASGKARVKHGVQGCVFFFERFIGFLNARFGKYFLFESSVMCDGFVCGVNYF
jgi:hypothetical protein